MIPVDELEVKLVETALKSDQVKIETVRGRIGWHVSMPGWDAPIHVWYGHPCWEECTNVWQSRVDASKRRMLELMNKESKPGGDWGRFKKLAALTSLITVVAVVAVVSLMIAAGLHGLPLWVYGLVGYGLGVCCSLAVLKQDNWRGKIR